MTASTPRELFPVVLPAIVDVTLGAHGQKCFARPFVARHHDAESQRPGYRYGHLPEAARPAGNEQPLSRLHLQLLDQPLPGRQTGQRDGGRHVECISGGHLRHHLLPYGDVFGKGANPLQRKACIDGIARSELPDAASDPLDNARALVAQRLRQTVILYQLDASPDDERLQWIDGRRAYLDEYLIGSRFGYGDLPYGEPSLP